MLHFITHLGSQFPDISLKYLLALLDIMEIVGARLLADATALAFVRMIIETNFVFPRLDIGFMQYCAAFAGGVEFFDQFQQRLHRTFVAVGTVVSATF